MDEFDTHRFSLKIIGGHSYDYIGKLFRKLLQDLQCYEIVICKYENILITNTMYALWFY